MGGTEGSPYAPFVRATRFGSPLSSAVDAAELLDHGRDARSRPWQRRGSGRGEGSVEVSRGFRASAPIEQAWCHRGCGLFWDACGDRGSMPFDGRERAFSLAFSAIAYSAFVTQSAQREARRSRVSGNTAERRRGRQSRRRCMVSHGPGPRRQSGRLWGLRRAPQMRLPCVAWFDHPARSAMGARRRDCQRVATAATPSADEA
jgi:hypothetical protein